MNAQTTQAQATINLVWTTRDGCKWKAQAAGFDCTVAHDENTWFARVENTLPLPEARPPSCDVRDCEAGKTWCETVVLQRLIREAGR